MPEHESEASAETVASLDAPRAKRKGKAKRRHTVAKVVVATAAVLALVTGLTIVYAVRHLNGNLNVADIEDTFVEPHPEKVEVEGPKEPLNIMVMGVDSRDCEGCDIDGISGEGGSDTTIFVHLSADRKRAYGVSIPRDTLVTRPDCRNSDGDIVPGADDSMWNAAFSLAGAGCTISQFEQISGIPIDHFVVVNFAGFRDMVDAVGGVEVCIPEDIDDRSHGIYLKAGTREISGKEALSYVRERHGVGDGSDIGRIKRQQAFVASMAHKVLSAGTLANPIRLYKFLDAATKSLTLDKGLGDLTKIADIGAQFRDIGLDKVQFLTVPWQYDPADPNRVRMLPEADELWRLLRNDQPLPKKFTSGAITAQDVPSATATTSPTPDGTDTPTTTGPTQTPTPNETDKAEAAAVGLCA